jgi:hypothetical protein
VRVKLRYVAMRGHFTAMGWRWGLPTGIGRSPFTSNFKSSRGRCSLVPSEPLLPTVAAPPFMFRTTRLLEGCVGAGVTKP